jgi:BirA family transcriptional regulator, biotin operon repressor / biotin---[acetyl-CoA-carboxylase] ligase
MFEHRHVSTIGSTNSELMEWAIEGEVGPLWLTAGQQLSGRGRSDRRWASPPGNLYASLLLSDPCPMRNAPAIGFVAGLALIAALHAVAPSLRHFTLKWPNDVLAGGAKLAGILPEARQINERFVLVIGMGVNCAFHPEGTPYPATSLAAEGVPINPMVLFSALNQSMVGKLAAFNQGHGLPAILQEWRSHAHGLGGPIAVRPPMGELSGIFEDIDADGALLLRQGEAVRRISAGDVYFQGQAALGASN